MSIDQVPKMADLIAKYSLEGTDAETLCRAVLAAYQTLSRPYNDERHEDERQEDAEERLNELTEGMSPTLAAAFAEFCSGLIDYLESRV